MQRLKTPPQLATALRVALTHMCAAPTCAQILKMHYPAVLLEAGVNVMLTDVDVAFPRSFYPDMKTGRLAGKPPVALCSRHSC